LIINVVSSYIFALGLENTSLTKTCRSVIYIQSYGTNNIIAIAIELPN